MRFGEKLRALREERGISQRQLAKRLGIGAARVCDIESGFSFPGVVRFTRLLKALGASLADFDGCDFESKGARRPGRGRPKKGE